MPWARPTLMAAPSGHAWGRAAPFRRQKVVFQPKTPIWQADLKNAVAKSIPSKWTTQLRDFTHWVPESSWYGLLVQL